MRVSRLLFTSVDIYGTSLSSVWHSYCARQNTSLIASFPVQGPVITPQTDPWRTRSKTVLARTRQRRFFFWLRHRYSPQPVSCHPHEVLPQGRQPLSLIPVTHTHNPPIVRGCLPRWRFVSRGSALCVGGARPALLPCIHCPTPVQLLPSGSPVANEPLCGTPPFPPLVSFSLVSPIPLFAGPAFGPAPPRCGLCCGCYSNTN